ncbi:cell division control protein Cdc6 [Haladaptatus sp. R4]|uniref:orc1/cdc6 family replication initiation protein n=1 Tax=Haladaptatus sp. R4 TaxID=1679489 RepID=UPI0007B482A2|nr:orc1/cdc6 family replication initiation protein [Haladaptatus sp. R4]KZN26048.1 cell division control protein Cdc6 [Haladaptatus sp. R4]
MPLRFAPDDHPFNNRDALKSDYTPNELVGRDDEMENYHAALQPVINREDPDNIFLYGKTGVGKTAATKYILEILESDASKYDIPVRSEYIDCDNADTSYRTAVKLLNRLRTSGEEISETGHSKSYVYDQLWVEIDNLEGTFLVILDEVDHLKDDSILYQLSRTGEKETLQSTNIAVIGISNDMTYRDSLSPKVRSSLCERSIQFPPYDAEELQAVLQQRADVAFLDDILSDDVIPLCSAYGAQESGDARKSLDLLMKAGDIERRENDGKVTAEHVRRGREELQREELANGIANLNEHERLVIYALATFEAEGNTPVRSKNLYDRYQKLAERTTDALTSRWMRDHLDEMDMLGIVNTSKQNLGMSGGQYWQISLAADLQLTVDAIEDIIEFTGTHESIREYVDDS